MEPVRLSLQRLVCKFHQHQVFLFLPPCPNWVSDSRSILSHGYHKASSQGVKQPECETDHLFLSSAEVENVCSHISAPYVIMIWYLSKHRDNFSFIEITDLDIMPQESPRSPGAVGTQQPGSEWAADRA